MVPQERFQETEAPGTPPFDIAVIIDRIQKGFIGNTHYC